MSRETSLFARQRIIISRAVVIPLMALVFMTESAWELVPPVDGFIFVAGCLLVGMATVGRLWCSIYICGRKTKELVTCGPYALTRNPLYFFSALGALGVGFATETLTIPALLILLFAATYPSVMASEERKLRAIHPVEFAAYEAATPRFFPRLARVIEPETYEVSPRIFRRALFDALWFVWLVGILELAEALREGGLLPSLLTLY